MEQKRLSLTDFDLPGLAGAMVSGNSKGRSNALYLFNRRSHSSMCPNSEEMRAACGVLCGAYGSNDEVDTALRDLFTAGHTITPQAHVHLLQDLLDGNSVYYKSYPWMARSRGNYPDSNPAIMLVRTHPTAFLDTLRSLYSIPSLNPHDHTVRDAWTEWLDAPMTGETSAFGEMLQWGIGQEGAPHQPLRIEILTEWLDLALTHNPHWRHLSVLAHAEKGIRDYLLSFSYKTPGARELIQSCIEHADLNQHTPATCPKGARVRL